VILVAGPTGVGKSAAALALSERIGGEVVSADSIQIYRGFDVGSSKPSAEDRARILHHLIDALAPTEPVDAMRYAALADAAIADIHGRGRVPVVVGGTGLWLRALVRGLVALPPVDPSLRTDLESQWDAAGPEAMHARLHALDPVSAARIHAHDKLRVVRALEVHAQTGMPLGELRRAHASGEPRFSTFGVLLDLEPAHWRTGIAERTRAMLDAGWVDEVRGLIAQHGPELRPLRSVGYRQICEHLRGELPPEDLEPAILRATRVYGRRQRTWFRPDPDLPHHLTPAQLMSEETLGEIERFLRG
jgi:tRNA dimethylallyltransferase